MEIRKASRLHEIMILMIYVIVSPFLFGIMYTNGISGDQGMIYLEIIFLTLLTSGISILFISSLKSINKKRNLEVLYGVVPMVVSAIILFCINLDREELDPMQRTLCVSNFLLLSTLYACSILYKLYGRKIE